MPAGGMQARKAGARSLSLSPSLFVRSVRAATENDRVVRKTNDAPARGDWKRSSVCSVQRIRADMDLGSIRARTDPFFVGQNWSPQLCNL